MKEFNQLLKENNIKITPQRALIYAELIGLDHPSADILFNKVKKTFPNISYDTVYRTLLTYSRIGLLDVVEGYGEPKRFDTNTDSHHHFRCLQCSSITDIKRDHFDNLEIPEEIFSRFQVLRSKVVLEGICKKCKK